MVISRDYTPTVRNLEMEEERMMNRCLYCKNEVTRYLFCSYPCYLGYSDNDGDKMSTIEELQEKIANIEIALQQAAKIERMLRDTKRILDAKAYWVDYLYSEDDRKDQEPEVFRPTPSAKDIDLYERVVGWLRLLGMRTDHRTVMGKKIIWARANRFSYPDIAVIAGMPPKTCENWYKCDIRILAGRVSL